jgi:hypothetical protein
VVIARDVGAEVLQEFRYILMRRRNIGGPAWVHPADPVLFLPDDTTPPLISCSGEKVSVQGAQILDGDPPLEVGEVESAAHRTDVSEHSSSGVISGGEPNSFSELFLGKAPRIDLETLDVGGADGFSAEKQTCN